MRDLVVSVGGKHNAKIKKTWRGSFDEFVKSLLSKVPETRDKASNGWVCGAEFSPAYRDSENFVARHLLSLDYDHITPEEQGRVLEYVRGFAHFAYTTWSHSALKPRIRVWIPLSRPCSYDEFQAVSRRVADSAGGIESAARESHVPAQYMFRPAIKPFEEFEHWENTQAPWIDVDEVLSTYDNWTDRSSWPHRAEGDGVHNEGTSQSPLDKPGLVGAFCRSFTISDAIEKFDLPYKAGSSEGRLTYTEGSRPDGAIVYDNDTKLHSHHDTDPARGQNNAFDLVRLHRFGALDKDMAVGTPLAQRPSSKAMANLAREQPAVAKQLVCDEGFEDLTLTDREWDDLPGGQAMVGGSGAPGSGSESSSVGALPERIAKPTSKFTDQENARRIQHNFGHKLISIGGTFYHWTGTHWSADEAQALRRIMRLSQIVGAEAKAVEEALIEEGGGALTDEGGTEVKRWWAWANDCGQLKRINACRTILRDTLDFKAVGLNKSAHLFSCLNGTLNLRTGDMHAHDPKDFITACSPVAFDPTAKAPRFEQFLREIFNGDTEVIAFAQRWFGYCLTGSVDEHKMVFHIGGGGNGKSTLMDLLRFVLGPEYYSTAPPNLLTLEAKGATPELARLLGRRMVTIAETEESLELREGLIKQLTGGDAVAARMLFKDYFEFLPSHKLQVFTNFTPQIRGQDFAIWRRILLLEYPNSYGDAVQVARGEAKLQGDPNLEIALQAEAPGVLRWLVEGAQEWYRGRLRPPHAVQEATKHYREEQDLMGKFASERLIADPLARTALTGTANSIFPAYRGWCSSMNLRPVGRPRFVKEILRVAPGAFQTSWLEGTTTIHGFAGIALTGDTFLD